MTALRGRTSTIAVWIVLLSMPLWMGALGG